MRRGMGRAGQVVLLIDGAVGLEHMGTENFKDAVQIVDFFHGLEHAGAVVEPRCIHNGRRTDDFWKHRLNTHAALNDPPLPLAT